MDFSDLYNFLEQNKHELNFIKRDDVITELGTSQFSTLFWNEERKDIPEDIKNFLVQQFKITDTDFEFLQIQKYEVGDYILPHKDTYPCFGLLILSTSELDGIVVEQTDHTYKFFKDEMGNMINVPKFSWHWVSPVREKTRYSAVYGLEPLNNLDAILDT